MTSSLWSTGLGIRHTEMRLVSILCRCAREITETEEGMAETGNERAPPRGPSV